MRTPSFMMILSSCRSNFFQRLSVLCRSLSFSSCSIRSFKALRRGSASCSFLMRAFSLIAPNEYSAELCGVFISSVTLADTSFSFSCKESCSLRVLFCRKILVLIPILPTGRKVVLRQRRLMIVD